MKASEIIQHAIEQWEARATHENHRYALGLIKIGVGKIVQYLGDVDLQIQWKPPRSGGPSDGPPAA